MEHMSALELKFEYIYNSHSSILTTKTQISSCLGMNKIGQTKLEVIIRYNKKFITTDNCSDIL